MSRYDLSREELAAVLDGEPPYRVGQVWDGLHRQHREPSELTALPRSLRARLAAEPALAPAWREAGRSTSDRSSTVKLLLEDEHAQRVETVVMAYRHRTTVCVSSQVGCAMGCSFCATGQLGFGRHLTHGEIVEQVVIAQRLAEASGWGRVSNVVMMGMGEPLANVSNVLEAIRRMNESLGIGARGITVSTVGVVPGIDRLAAEPLQVNLAVSLHAGNDALRTSLVPLNERYPIAAVIDALGRYRERTGRRVSFEWACIAGVNDSDSDADELAAISRGLGAHVNLIPLNPTPGYLVAGSPPARVARFRDRLRELGVNATVRDTRGRDVDAACGQLAAGMAVGGLRRPRRVAVAHRLA